RALHRDPHAGRGALHPRGLSDRGPGLPGRNGAGHVPAAGGAAHRPAGAQHAFPGHARPAGIQPRRAHAAPAAFPSRGESARRVKMTLEIEGGVTVVTGAASGIGSGLVRKALALGMRVVLADVQERALAEFAAGLRGEVLAVPTDVADAASVERLAQRAYEAYGRVDLLSNNAGVLTTGYVWEIEPALWKRSLDINLYGVLHGLRAFVP